VASFHAPALYLILITVEGYFITPNVEGKRFTLSPLAVFLSRVLWTWLWGPAGGFLAVPILIISLTTFSRSLFRRGQLLNFCATEALSN
jgi:predicted PurR-regulated permease PerM